MKILVVEDSRSKRLLLTQYVEKFGAATVSVNTGEAALEAYSSMRPDLVLLDVILPDIDGFVVAQRIRAMEQQGDWTPIIFLSARGDDTNIEKGITARGDDYLLKPFSEIVLVAKIRAMQCHVRRHGSLLALTRKLDVANQELVRISTSNCLTGVSNRRFSTKRFPWNGVRPAAPGVYNPPDDLIHAADKALYPAKREGRDRVCLADAA